jgi:hypothetical protein
MRFPHQEFLYMCNTRKVVLSLCLGMLLGLAAPTAHAGDPPAAQGEASLGAEMVGSWQGVTSIGTTVLHSFHPDGTFSSTFHFPGVGAGNGHGAWIQTGLQTYAITDVGLILDADNELVLFLNVEGTGTMVGNVAEFEVLVNLSLPDGTPVDSFPAAVLSKRIEVTPAPVPLP